MSISPLLPLAAVAAGPVAERAADGLAQGLSFAQTLAEQVSDHLPGAAASSENEGSVDQAQAPEPTSIHSLDRLQRLARRELDRLLDKLHPRLASQGIRLEEPITLKSDGRHGVIASEDHPHRAAIEELFASDPDLAESFHRLAATASTAQRQSHQGRARLSREFHLVLGQQGAQMRFE